MQSADDGKLIFSGGIGELARPRSSLRRARLPGCDGVIVGKALYERRFTVAEALALEQAPSAPPLCS